MLAPLSRPRTSTLLLASLVCSLLGCSPAADDVGAAHEALRSLDEVTDFGPNPGALSMFLYEPTTLPAGPRPVVVALHGCSMTAASYADAGWNDLADEWGFIVIYPQQNNGANNSLGCLNWGGGWDGMPNAFASASAPLHLGDLERGQSENGSIMQMVEHIKATRDVDDRRIYVTGLSAGGGMAALMLATWPDVFAGGAIVAGIAHGCATDRANVGEARACIGNFAGANAYLDRTPEAWAALVRDAHPGYGGPYPKVSIWQGTSDFTVNPAGATELVEQWTGVHGLSTTPSSSETVDGADREVFTDSSGQPVVESWTLTGMGHGTPVDPSSGCGTSGAWILDRGICSARQAGLFFGLDGTGPADPPPTDPPPADPSAPTVSFTSPGRGVSLSGTVAVDVRADDPDGVVAVRVYVDDALEQEVGGAAAAFLWNTTVLPNAAYRLRAEAEDATGAVGVAEVQVLVNNSGMPPATEPPGGTEPPPSTERPSTPGGDSGGGSTIAGCSTAPGAPAPRCALLALAGLAYLRRRARA